MIVVHHLNDSRSQRILWLLEELGLAYEVKPYRRDEQTRLAPPELKKIHPLGKSPVITDGNRTIIESGAIIDYVIRHHGKGRLQPAPDSPAYDGVPAMDALRGRLGDASADAQPLCRAAG